MQKDQKQKNYINAHIFDISNHVTIILIIYEASFVRSPFFFSRNFFHSSLKAEEVWSWWYFPHICSCFKCIDLAFVSKHVFSWRTL